jgi:multiple sugar transport system permease protein
MKPAVNYCAMRRATPPDPKLRDYTRDEETYPQYFRLQEWFSFQRNNSITYVLASDVVFMIALFNTFFFVVVIAPVQGGLALLLAMMLNQKLPGINVFRTIYFMPVVVSMVVVALLWRFIYDGSNGVLNTLLATLTFGGFKPVDWLANPQTATPALMAMSVWQAVGFHMVIWLAGLQTIPTLLYEAANVEGADWWQKFRFVTWPGLRNTAVFVLIIITDASLRIVHPSRHHDTRRSSRYHPIRRIPNGTTWLWKV